MRCYLSFLDEEVLKGMVPLEGDICYSNYGSQFPIALQQHQPVPLKNKLL